ncbi:MAG: hypothetical protein WDO19_21995 [Bacteroidota bacterium]
MKKLVVIMAALVLTLGVSAQKRGGGYFRPRTYVVVGGGFGYSPFYSPFYNPWYYPGYGYNTYHRPTKLDMQIADIKADYSDRIWSAKHDTSLSRKERRREVHNLRHERDQAVLNAKRNYHSTPR